LNPSLPWLSLWRPSFFYYSIILCFCLTKNIETNAQEKKPGFVRRYIHSLINDTSDISKPQFLAYPTLAYSKETSWEIGLSSLFVFYANRDTNNRLSEVSGFTFYTFEKQYGTVFDHALYTHQTKWAALGRIRFQNFPLKYFGIGNDTKPEPLATVSANLFSVKERILRKVKSNLFVGLEADFQNLGSVKFTKHGSAGIVLPEGSGGSANLGFGIGVIYDQRHNPLNVRKGIFSELAFLRYDDAWGSDYSFSNILLDNRIYIPVNKRDVLATQVLVQFGNGNIPFNMLSLMGGDNIMRGYYQGRYRDKNQVAGQVEYRMLPLPLGFTKRIGATVFGGAGSVFNSFSNLSADQFVFSGGAGLRFLLFPKKDIYGRFDLAFTKEGTGIYMLIGEAF
jgi:hypothetical protein